MLKENNNNATEGSKEKNTGDAVTNSGCCRLSEGMKNQVQKEKIDLTEKILSSPEEKVREALYRYRSRRVTIEKGKETVYFMGILENMGEHWIRHEPIQEELPEEQNNKEVEELNRKAEEVFNSINTSGWTEEDRDELHTIYANIPWYFTNGKIQNIHERIDEMLKLSGKYRAAELKKTMCEVG